MMKQSVERFLGWALAISFGLSIITLLLYAYLGSYMRMIVDDFCTANIGLYYGAWDGFLYMYTRWASNYSNFIIKYGLAPLQPQLHPWLGLLTVLAWYAAFYYCSLQIFAWLKAPNSK